MLGHVSEVALEWLLGLGQLAPDVEGEEVDVRLLVFLEYLAFDVAFWLREKLLLRRSGLNLET